MPPDGPTARALVVDAIRDAADLIALPDTGEAWDSPSALEGMTVGALSAHLVRAAGATIAYLDRTDPDARPDGDLLTPVTYFHAAIDSPIHGQIRDVSADEAAIGHAAMADKCATLAEDMATRLGAEPPDRLVGALGGRMLSLDDFCRTRLIEILFHVDDLAASLGRPTPDMSPDATGVVIDILVGIARSLHGDLDVMRALARAERASDGVIPVF